jgi:hypothetical protein
MYGALFLCIGIVYQNCLGIHYYLEIPTFRCHLKYYAFRKGKYWMVTRCGSVLRDPIYIRRFVPVHQNGLSNFLGSWLKGVGKDKANIRVGVCEVQKKKESVSKLL